MYQQEDNARAGRAGPDGLSTVAPEVRAGHAAARVRQALSDAPPGFSLDRSQLQTALGHTLADPVREGERCFALGWLRWLAGEPQTAEPLLSRAGELLPPRSPELAQAAYWLARVRLLNHRPEAVAAFEQLLRTLSGSPQATCWFVDLLWRSGRSDRAEQVWKPVRVNRRVTACAEAFLLETRALLRQGDLNAAERTLREATPRGGILQAERALLLAWLLAGRRQFDEAQALLGQARAAFYPSPALEAWQALLHQRSGQDAAGLPAASLLAPAARAWVAGQTGRVSGAEPATVIASLHTARASPILRPFARYALACLGQEDFTALLAELPGNFLAPRCRLWLTLARFCRREAPAAELLSALQQAATAGHGATGRIAWQQFAQLLTDPARPPGELWPGEAVAEDALTANRRRAAVERALQELAAEKALPLLVSWSRATGLRQDAPLRKFVGLQLLRLLLVRKETGPAPEELNEAAELLGSPVLPALVAGLRAPDSAGERSLDGQLPDNPRLAEMVRLWQTALTLTHSPEGTVPALDESGTAGILARSLRLYQAARAGAAAAVAALLEPVSEWSALSAGPPAFVVRALRSIRPGGSSAGRWQQAIAHWLQAWTPETLGVEGQSLGVQVGLSFPHPNTAEPPAGAEAAAWFLYQASQALGREDAVAALAWARRGLAQNTGTLAEEQAQTVQQALPELEHLAQAQLLAEAIRLDPGHPAAAPALCADLRDLLADFPEGQQLLTAVDQRDLAAVREQLAALAQRADLPSRLLHHLALVYYRAARAFEEQERTDAELCWRLSWRCWLAWAAQQNEGPDVRPLLFDHLLGLHRDRLRDLLARNEVDRGRRYWELVGQLPSLAPLDAEQLTETLRRRLEQFRESLATDFLLDTREAMRHGAAPEGWRADYEQGLTRLRRLLSLDRSNLRLLTALVEICGDWFLDLYDTQDAARMRSEVERYTPFALQLARGCAAAAAAEQGWPGELAARAVLSEFFKFRGFIADDWERKRALYREALELNPANDNVRKLLADLEGKR